MTDFKANEIALGRMKTLGDMLTEFAFEQTEEFMACGHPAGESGSITATLLVRIAWVVAATGVIAEGREPNPQNFRDVVEETLKRTTFNKPEENSGG